MAFAIKVIKNKDLFSVVDCLLEFDRREYPYWGTIPKTGSLKILFAR